MALVAEDNVLAIGPLTIFAAGAEETTAIGDAGGVDVDVWPDGAVVGTAVGTVVLYVLPFPSTPVLVWYPAAAVCTPIGPDCGVVVILPDVRD